jgi:hypothetical protein
MQAFFFPYDELHACVWTDLMLAFSMIPASSNSVGHLRLICNEGWCQMTFFIQGQLDYGALVPGMAQIVGS